MKHFLIIFIVILICIVKFLPCKNFTKADSGFFYTARNKQTANMIDFLREISHDIVNKLGKEDSLKLKNRLKNTSFGELINGKDGVIAYNTDKGREIYIKLYNNKQLLPPELIIKALLHELSHSLLDSVGHGEDFKMKDEMMQGFRDFYVNKFVNNKF